MKALAAVLGIHYIDIDAGPAQCGPPQEINPYASEISRAREGSRMRVAYTIMHAAIAANLNQGFSLAACATYSRQGSQKLLKDAVESEGGVLKFILCQYDDTEAEVERRIQKRVQSGALGGCRSVQHYYEDKARWEGINLPHLVVQMNGEDGVAKAVAAVLEHLAL